MCSSSIGRAVSSVFVVKEAGAFDLPLGLTFAADDILGPPLGLSVTEDFTDVLTAGEDDFALRLGLVTVSPLPSSTDKAAKALLLTKRDMALEPVYRMTRS